MSAPADDPVGPVGRNRPTGTPVAISGSLTVKWKTTPKLTTSSTVITGSTAATSLDVSAGAFNFVINGSGATGPFQGSNSGASDVVAGSTGPGTVAALATTCAREKGLKGLTLTSPLSGPGASLG